MRPAEPPTHTYTPNDMHYTQTHRSRVSGVVRWRESFCYPKVLSGCTGCDNPDMVSHNSQMSRIEMNQEKLEKRKLFTNIRINKCSWKECSRYDTAFWKNIPIPKQHKNMILEVYPICNLGSVIQTLYY
ncbi:unnamed protein product [Callosobruchus maculatus]|uniref:Uncharacterized protein n=1 Tax=Callosobruchus maculatus TaxID=64391 RepID=A0A653D209_CALMS|nr:unnamed protein product [Callosobruchus maculatus]